MFDALRLDADSENKTSNDLTGLVARCHEAGWKEFTISEIHHYETVYDSNDGYGLLLPADDIPDALHRRWTGGWFYFSPCSETKEYYEAADIKPLTIADLPWALS